MKNAQIEPDSIEFTVTNDYGDAGTNKASYDVYPLACFVADEMDEEMLAGSAYNEIAEKIRDTQLNLSQLYITVLELIQEGKINKHALCHLDNFTHVGNQLEFLNKLGRAFQGITINLENTKNSKK